MEEEAVKGREDQHHAQEGAVQRIVQRQKVLLVFQ
jgi:hypothetical protein